MPGTAVFVEVVDSDGRGRRIATAWPATGSGSGAVADFTVTMTITPSAGRGRSDVHLDVTYRGDVARDAGIRVGVEFDCTPPDLPFWLIPGLFYGENRPERANRPFPRFVADPADMDAMASDHWEFRADRAATPAVFAFTRRGGVALLTSDTTPLGMSGIGFGYRCTAAEVHLTFPFSEAPVSYTGQPEPVPAEVATHRWRPGESVAIDLALHVLTPDRHDYAAVLREEHARLAPSQPLHPWVSLEQAAELSAHGLFRWHYAEPGVLLETVGFDREVSGHDGQPVDRQAMHVGWVSGIPWAYALLRHGRRAGNGDYARAAASVIGFICANLCPAGTFWGVWYRDRGWSQSWSPTKGALHSRTLGEATQFLVRALELGMDVRAEQPGWAAAAVSNLDAVVARQRADGNLGSAHHAQTGEVLSWAGSSGLAWVAALAEAERWDSGGAYLAAAERAGEYYASFVRAEFLHGAPEDVDLAPTSEDGYLALMAYMALYRRSGQARWLDLARRAADWMLTFRYSYNIAFPEGTLLAAYDFRTRGADNASPSNQHLHAYGLICTRELGELSTALGDPYYRERGAEALACFRQFVARFDGDFNAYQGMVSERYYHTRCFQPKGMVLTLSHAWSVGALLLGCEQALAAGASCE